MHSNRAINAIQRPGTGIFLTFSNRCDFTFKPFNLPLRVSMLFFILLSILLLLLLGILPLILPAVAVISFILLFILLFMLLSVPFCYSLWCYIIEFLVGTTFGYLGFQNILATIASFMHRDIVNKIDHLVFTNGKWLGNLQFITG